MPKSKCSSEFHQIDRLVSQKLLELIAAMEKPARFASKLEVVCSLLSAVTNDPKIYETAIARLNRALRYVRSNEVGLAKYELHLLRSGLKAVRSQRKSCQCEV